MEIPENMEAQLESPPKIVKQMFAEVTRIHNQGEAQSEAEQNFVMAVLEYDYALKTGNQAYAHYIFEVILAYFDVSPEAALQLVWQRAAEFAKNRGLGGQV